MKQKNIISRNWMYKKPQPQNLWIAWKWWRIARPLKRHILTVVPENCQNSAVNHSVEKLNLVNFLNLSKSKIVSGYTHIDFYFDPDPMVFTFSVDFSILKEPCALKVVIWSNWVVTKLWQRHKFDIFQKMLFCSLASNVNFVL